MPRTHSARKQGRQPAEADQQAAGPASLIGEGTVVGTGPAGRTAVEDIVVGIADCTRL